MDGGESGGWWLAGEALKGDGCRLREQSGTLSRGLERKMFGVWCSAAAR